MNYVIQNNPLHGQRSRRVAHWFQKQFYHMMLALKNRSPPVLEVNRILKASTLGVKVRLLIDL